MIDQLIGKGVLVARVLNSDQHHLVIQAKEGDAWKTVHVALEEPEEATK